MSRKFGRFHLTCEPWHFTGTHGGHEIMLKFSLEVDGEEHVFTYPFESHTESVLDVAFDRAKAVFKAKLAGTDEQERNWKLYGNKFGDPDEMRKMYNVEPPDIPNTPTYNRKFGAQHSSSICRACGQPIGDGRHNCSDPLVPEPVNA
jgi:hypothetical protein